MGNGKSRERSFVDANIFLYAIQGHPEFGKTSKKVLKRIDENEEAVTSVITLAEVCWWLEKHKQISKIQEQIKLILSIFNLNIVQITQEDFLNGAELIRELDIDFNDCLNLAVMRRLGIGKIYSNDSDFDKANWVERVFD
ncbi:hypothetical protein AKJ53_01205 [candidate division MSBL1 archaeon SCGC-AAA382F02]|uniref:PIN domain-containing protein n=1 Tax=candidate division MSBL1 archaeon SCGC-AAA382F02 TaxID=1698282 RepID=A0A133VI61_9EURY|nr:hypothetical protein AKJ53_01205 [candidate division MSBL1 archaeon SCGC-AAA382F02]